MKLFAYRSVPSLRSGRAKFRKINNSYNYFARSQTFLDTKLTGYNRNRTSKKTSSRPAGRNITGHITVRHQGGGHKQAYRQIDWYREAFNSSDSVSFVVGFSYDPQRSARLALIYTPALSSSQVKGTYSYIIAPEGLQLFQKLQKVSNVVQHQSSQPGLTSTTKLLSVGDLAPLSSFEVGDYIHSVEAFPGQGPVFARSAGTYCQFRGQSAGSSSDQTGETPIEGVDSGRAKVRLPSGSIRLISTTAHAVLGAVGNSEHNQRNLEKAGRSRWLGRRPSVRGVARNPVDHPHGGGQGKTSGGRPSVTFKSWPTKGQPTRSPKRNSNYILSPRKKSKKLKALFLFLVDCSIKNIFWINGTI